MLNAVAQRQDLENLLLLVQLERQMRYHGVDQAARLINTGQRRHHLGGYLLTQLHKLLELAHQTAHQHFGFALVQRALLQQLDLGALVAFNLFQLDQPSTPLALNQHLDGAVRQLEQLQDGCQGTNVVKRVAARIVVTGVTLRHQQHLFVPGHGGLKGLDGFVTPDKQRDDHVRIDHYVAQR